MAAKRTRTVFTLAVGNPKFAEMAMGLARSLSLIGDTTPRAIITDIDGFEWARYFDVVVRRSIPPEELYWAKFYALEHTQADQILFLDGDSLAFKRLDPIFTAFDGSAVGVQGVLMNSGRWYQKDLAEVCAREEVERIPKFNGGMIYYERTADAYSLLAEARAIAERYDETGFSRLAGGRARAAVPDEPCVALAMARTGIGRTIPDTANFDNSAVGLIGKLRIDVRRNECRYLCRRYDVQYVEPFIFHAHFYASFLVYWRQLRALEGMERYEDQHPFGYMSPAHKLSRSIQRRLIKLRHGRHLRPG